MFYRKYLLPVQFDLTHVAILKQGLHNVIPDVTLITLKSLSNHLLINLIVMKKSFFSVEIWTESKEL